MRFDTPVYFQRITSGAYDPETGDYGVDSMAETMRFASVTNSGVETVNLIYGEVKQGSLTIRLQRRHEEAFDRIRIGDKVYRADFVRTLRNMQTFVVSEVQ